MLGDYDDSKAQLDYCNLKIKELSKPDKKGLFARIRNR